MAPMPNSIMLSSRMTFVAKFVFPLLWITGFGVGTAAMWTTNPSPAAWHEGGSFSRLAGGHRLPVWLCVPLKKVRVEGDNLSISNYQKEIMVPLALVDRVSEIRWINIHPVTIYFRSATDFGDKIVFMPKARFALGFSSHRSLPELTQMADAARRGAA